MEILLKIILFIVWFIVLFPYVSFAIDWWKEKLF